GAPCARGKALKARRTQRVSFGLRLTLRRTRGLRPRGLRGPFLLEVIRQAAREQHLDLARRELGSELIFSLLRLVADHGRPAGADGGTDVGHFELVALLD